MRLLLPCDFSVWEELGYGGVKLSSSGGVGLIRGKLEL